ncbi:beta-1,3-galactosyltransferase 2-like [Macrobrachium rosenbergii]|uniref:beta-1,3-galactosyltransferase 2-like n=1 Tax=Macrobrachium rosenbergii TaxID=79674 RepID=UPI0034D7B2A5
MNTWKLQVSTLVFLLRYGFLVSALLIFLAASSVYSKHRYFEYILSKVREDFAIKNNGGEKHYKYSYATTKYLIEEKDLCLRRPNLQIIGYVISAIKRAENRRVTRETWANATSNMAVTFVVGLPENNEEQQLILEESREFRDILQVDLADDYRSQSYKGLSALSWINVRCQDVPWTLRADENVLIDVFSLSTNLRSFDVNKTDHFYCSTRRSEAVKEELSASTEEYPTAGYPVFCAGKVWLLPTKAIPRLLRASEGISLPGVDDVYITGVLAEEANLTRFGGPDSLGSNRLKAEDTGINNVLVRIKGDLRYYWQKIVHKYK